MSSAAVVISALRVKIANHMCIRMYGYIFRGSYSVICIFASLLKRDLLSKERTCSPGSKFFPLSVNPSLEGLCQLEKQTQSHESCSPLEKRQKNMEVYIH